MADEGPTEPTLEDKDEEEQEYEAEEESSSSSSSEEESEYDSDDSNEGGGDYYGFEEEAEDDNSPQSNIRRFMEVLESKSIKREQEEEEREITYQEDLFDFPKDPENWREEDLKELWVDAPVDMTKPGWDPAWADEEDWEVVKEEIKAGRDPAIAPFYLPYRKCYPVIPDNHYDISNPKSVIEELDRIEEFLKWVSYIFPDGSSYEGTVWDDLAHGKGVYVAEQGLVRYEGEWLQNNMEGHGVVEVEIPGIEPVPGSKLEARMRAEGKIISRDYMSPEDREWLEMDIEDSIRLARGNYEIPFTENKEWIRLFGQKPEKGRYRYAGQWKHGRMHGCGVYEVNERPIYGRFYFGELLEDSTGCDANVSALHAGIAEVAAAKARMFVNKPDGMVREERGPYSDPQHPYLYEGEDVWMAPGFINQFYEVPNYWKKYVHEVDQEREMWLNSFYKAPFRIPMPAELEYWWSKDESPEFVLINKEPEPDPTDPSKLIYTEDPLIVHTRTGRLINYVEDEKYGIRLFWQPPLKDGEEVDPEKAQFLPLGFDEFYGRATRGPKKEGIWKRFIVSVENACKPVFDKLENWTEEKKKASEMKLKLIEQELEFIEAELCLEEAIEDMETELEKKQKEEEKKVEMGQLDAEDMSVSAPTDQDRTVSAEDEEEEEEEEDEATPTSFGSVLSEDQDLTKTDKKGSRPGKSPFATSSMLFASCGLALTVPSKLQQSFLSWKKGKSQTSKALRLDSCTESSTTNLEPFSVISFPCTLQYTTGLKLARQKSRRLHRRHDGLSQLHSLSRILSGPRASSMLKGLGDELSWGQWLHVPPDGDMDTILSMHFPLCTGSCTEVLTHEDLVVTGGTSC